jgi:hypothetical protein
MLKLVSPSQIMFARPSERLPESKSNKLRCAGISPRFCVQPTRITPNQAGCAPLPQLRVVPEPVRKSSCIRDGLSILRKMNIYASLTFVITERPAYFSQGNQNYRFYYSMGISI